MKGLAYEPDDLIYALATPWGESALAVVRTSGEGSVEKLAGCFSLGSRMAASKGYSLHHGYLLDPADGERIDEVMAAVYRKPKSYSGQDSVEIFCHGSLPGLQRIFELLRKSGFRQAEGGEFTLRAFLNGRMDLTRAEAVHEIVTSKSKKAQELALHRLSGVIFERIRAVKQEVLDILSQIEIQLDYPEDETEVSSLPLDALGRAETALSELGATYRTGRVYQEGARIAIAGRTNAGKSSLFNLFLREDRSIVSAVHGTTRDYIESWISLSGIPVRLYDTAGLRETVNSIEEEGIRRSRMIVGNARLVVYLVDGNEGLTEEDEANLSGTDGIDIIPVWNKIDRPVKKAPTGYFPLSAVSGEGFTDLENEIRSRLLKGGDSSAGEALIDSLRQKELIETAVASLRRVRESAEDGMPLDMLAVDLQEALSALGEITGEVTSADILNNMFSRFCVGK